MGDREIYVSTYNWKKLFLAFLIWVPFRLWVHDGKRGIEMKGRVDTYSAHKGLVHIA